MTDRRASMLFGALVADAASLGLHWLYDVDQIAAISDRQGGAVAFTPVDAANFDGGKGYFAHAARPPGALTQYGETLRLGLETVGDAGIDLAAYQAAFAAFFGPGGGYVGYIDRPTRGTLDNLSAKVEPSGIDDDQLPAITRVPLAVATESDVGAAIRITNVNEDAAAYGAVFADVLRRVLAGDAVADALAAAAAGAPRADVRAALTAAVDHRPADPVAYGDHTGRACHLPMAMPLAFHILAGAGTYADAVEANIRAGGDNAGRAIIVGAVMGAAHGIPAIPMDWALRLKDGDALFRACHRIAR